ncbi:hypothetical protein BOX15_Mlig024128g1, partial [Macrostomum lignano]
QLSMTSKVTYLKGLSHGVCVLIGPRQAILASAAAVSLPGRQHQAAFRQGGVGHRLRLGQQRYFSLSAARCSYGGVGGGAGGGNGSRKSGGGGGPANRGGGGGKSAGKSGGAGAAGASGGGSGGGHFSSTMQCPNCGALTISPMNASGLSVFLQCSNCQQFFLCQPEGREDAAKTADSIKEKEIPYPKKINAYLDKFVVGQSTAKRMLSVQVYSHYRRLQHHREGLILQQQQQAATSAQVGPGSLGSQLTIRDGGGGGFGGPEAFTTADLMNMTGVTSGPHGSVLGPRGGSGGGGVGSLRFSGSKSSSSSSGSGASGSSASDGASSSNGWSNSRGSDQLQSEQHRTRIDKSNILLLGPTGCGKTLLAQTLAQCLDVPFAICDCTTLTQAGYVGEDVESVVGKLLQDAGFSVERAEAGIVFLDEIDKISSRVGGMHATRDVGGEGVQQGMLKMVEGTIVNAPKGNRRERGETVAVDTSNILFIASGAFNGLAKIVRRREQQRGVGFNQPVSTGDPLTDDDKVLSRVEARDLIDFGMIPEFVGRFPVISVLHSLDAAMLARILVEPRNALISQYKLLFGMDQCNLEVTQEALLEIAQQAQRRQTGARGLRAILEALLLVPRYETPGSDVCEVRISAECARGQAQPEYIRRPSVPMDASEEPPLEQNFVK